MTLPERFERLRQLSAQLYAVTMIGSLEDVSTWHPEIREPYMCLMTDMSREVRDHLQCMVNAMPERSFEERQKRQAS